MSITRSVVAIVGEQAGDRKVVRVQLEIGQLSAVVPDAVRFCFDVVSRGTRLEGARLEILEIPGLGRCLDCGSEVALDGPITPCPCGSWRVEKLSGEELNIKEMEVEAA